MEADIHGKSRKNRGQWYLFKQQALPAWKPRYTSAGVSPLMISFGVLLIPLGIAVLIITSDSAEDIKEFQIDYTNCVSNNGNTSMKCADHLLQRWNSEDPHTVCQCDVEFELPKPIIGNKIYLYYSLENFHQNVRKYVQSRDDKQLKGTLGTVEDPYIPGKDCAPLDVDEESGKIFFPCGAIANSMFNDSLQLYFLNERGDIPIKQIRRGIAWDSDLKYRYKNPSEFKNKTADDVKIWENFIKPRDWSRTIWDLDPDDPENNGIQNEDFVVWMRVSTFSKFRKLYRIIKTSAQDALGDRLPAGKYRLRVNYTYEVVSFKGKKGFVISSPTIFGQQNLFQGIAAVSVGGVSVILGLVFLLCGCRNGHGKGFFTSSE